LKWAADARERAEWDRASVLRAQLITVGGGKWINPARLNPYRLKVRPQRRGPVTEQESALAWLALDNFFQRGFAR
jgi:hypothetical protein